MLHGQGGEVSVTWNVVSSKSDVGCLLLVVVSRFVVPLKGTFQIIEPRLAWLHAPVLKLGNGPCTWLKENPGEAGLRQGVLTVSKAPQNILLRQDSQVRQ